MKSLEAFKNLEEMLSDEDLKSILVSSKNLEANLALGLLFLSKLCDLNEVVWHGKLLSI